MTITIKIDTGNAAFEDRDQEIGRIVSHVARLLERGAIASGKREGRGLMDLNGNSVGTVTVTGR